MLSSKIWYCCHCTDGFIPCPKDRMTIVRKYLQYKFNAPHSRRQLDILCEKLLIEIFISTTMTIIYKNNFSAEFCWVLAFLKAIRNFTEWKQIITAGIAKIMFNSCIKYLHRFFLKNIVHYFSQKWTKLWEAICRCFINKKVKLIIIIINYNKATAF